MIRKVLAAAVAVALAAGVNVGSANATSEDAWTPPKDFDINSIGVNLVESFYNTGEQLSKLVSVSNSEAGKFEEHLCAGFGSSEFCKGSILGQVLLPVCLNAEQFNCIESLRLGRGEVPLMQPAKFVRQAIGPKVAADLAHGLTEGSTVSIWNSEVLNAKGSSDYAVYAALNVRFDQTSMVFKYENLTTMVVPFTQVSGPYSEPRASEFLAPDGTQHVGSSGGVPDCVFTEPGACGRIQNFEADTTVSITLRLTTALGGWFKGRIVEPQISITPGSSKVLPWQSITMSGRPASVPMVFARGQKSQATQEMIKFMGSYWIGGVNNLRSDSPGAFGALELFKPFTQDAAAGVLTVWSMGSIAGGSNPCLSDNSKVQGVVSTNAAIYEPNAPKFEGGQLLYKVAGPHYLPDKSTASEGTYDLLLDSKVARCLYGFSSAPISAAINVVSSDGTNKVAVTTFKESNGWVKLSARGFTFSNPTIAVKFTQDAPAAAKKTTITCVSFKNKKLTKKVTAVSPKCPVGFKQK